MNLDYDCVVIGAGISGMTAAIYLKRAEVKIALLEKGAPGGQMNKTSIIENYPGFTGIGPDLAMKVFEQVTNLNIPYVYADVSDIKKIDNGFEIIAPNKTITTKKIILATGREPNKLNVPNEDELTGRGVSWCAICDGPLYKDKVVAVVGSGNSALEEGIYLSNICKKVIMLNRSEKFKGSKMLQSKLFERKNIEVMFETRVQELTEKDNRLDKIIINHQDKQEELKVDGLFIYIGFTPDTQYLENLGVELEKKYVVTNSKFQTNIHGIYACGDIIKKDYYQISNAVGEAAESALSVISELEM